MRYLVATDGSTVSDTAVERAAREASVWDADLDVVHVLTPETKLVDGDIVLPGEEDAVDHAEEILDAAAETADVVADRDGITVETHLLTGRPAEAITTYADNAGVDAIFVGHRGSSERRRVGSVAKTVIDKASVPVTVTR
ncbi:UspA domain protein [Halosimplex carlsbadense 2-9-1]|uniref:UspA domain protein n=1 Tax=Halosimplex carlsbadense 2-9-1 TaxID=797114 RepID=M0CRA6_9EURY|nr:universal stress protein [Halosimplex carlsbadense]ELZ25795.1 UspA domain protein [Halosimplex carlsbadense 2-9-1]